jgi:hypothetical protein
VKVALLEVKLVVKRPREVERFMAVKVESKFVAVLE